MEAVFHYLLKVNICWILVYISYISLLKNLTFYKYNRIFILGGLVFGLLCPLLADMQWWQRSAVVLIPSGIPISYAQLVNKMSITWTYADLLAGIFLFIGTLLSLRFLLQLFGIYQIDRASQPKEWMGYRFQQVFHKIAPFSFLHKIYIYPDAHDSVALKQILAHESYHVRGRHSMDRLFMQGCCIFAWFNPCIWLLRKEMVDNLEFLTDEAVLASGVNKKVYQYSLVAVANDTKPIYITNTFNYFTLKKRIIMMNKKKSKKIALTAYALLLPCFLMAGGLLTIKHVDPALEEVVSKSFAPIVEKAVENQTPRSETIIADTSRVKGKVRIVRVSDSKNNTQDTIVKLIPSTGKDTQNKVFIFDGKQIDEKALEAIDVSTIKGVSVHKSDSIAKSYGVYGSDGVVILSSKTPEDSSTVRSGKVIGLSKKNAESPIVYLGDKRITMEEMKAISRNDISDVTVIKGENAIKLYGQSGKSGVILIKLK